MKDTWFHTPGEWDSRRCDNPGCRTIWLDPMPLEEDIHLAYRDYLISRQVTTDSRDRVSGFYRHVRKGYLSGRYGYDESVAFTDRLLGWAAFLNPSWKGALDANVFFLEHRPGGRLLEIGCGAGKQLKQMQELGWQATGVDADPEVARMARAQGLDVAEGQIYDQDYPDGSFDAVLLNHVIEHVYDLKRFMPELHRVLRPGGRLVMLTPNIESLGGKIFRYQVESFLDTPRHLYLFTDDSLRLVAAEGGFDRMKVFTTSRHAGFIYMSDKTIERTGYYMIPASPPLRDRLGAVLVGFTEAALNKVRPGLGEELVLIAEK
jgi:SAM-dependent methyltransferase